MPKRVAEEYITKDHGTSSNFDSADDKPKMSTAAQLAKRKYVLPSILFNFLPTLPPSAPSQELETSFPHNQLTSPSESRSLEAV